ncbi:MULTISPECIES: hypothetical protein [unclassified Blastococcus]
MHPLVASPVSSRVAAPSGAVFLRDVEDLHDADLDLVLADRLAESADALRAAVTAAQLAQEISQRGPLPVHALGPAAHRLAG